MPLSKYKSTSQNKVNPPVSVIIAAHNELLNLKQLLPAVLTQIYKDYEVIVVDDRSTDGTKKYLADLRHNHNNLRILPITQTPPNINPKKYALTEGIKAATNEILLFTDADCIPLSSQWIAEMAQGFLDNTTIVLGYSPYMAIYGFLNKLIRYETLLSAVQYLSFALKGQAYMGVGRNLGYTKTTFAQVNGFASHISTTGGDDDLFIRDAGRANHLNIVISKESQVISKPKQTYGEWIIQKRRHLNTGRQYKFPDKLRVGLFMQANILFYLIIFFLFLGQQNLELLALLFALRCVVVYSMYIAIARNLKENLSVMLLPLLDVAYFFNYLVLGVSVLMYNKVRWK